MSPLSTGIQRFTAWGSAEAIEKSSEQEQQNIPLQGSEQPMNAVVQSLVATQAHSWRGNLWSMWVSSHEGC